MSISSQQRGKSEVLGVIPARGGSRGVKRKNLREVGGVPLVVLAIRQAAGARTLGRVVVSTEDEEIAGVAREVGGDVPFMRPPELAGDDTRSLPVLLHALHHAEQEDGREYGHVVCIQPTSPLRTVEDIDGAVGLALETGADSVVSVRTAPHPAKIKRIEAGRLLPYSVEEPEGAPRQALGEQAWMRNGAVYVFRRDVLLSGRLWGADCRAYPMPEERSVDVDTESDLRLADLMARSSPIPGGDDDLAND